VSRRVVTPNGPALPFPNLSGRYFFPISTTQAGTAQVAQGSLRLYPWYSPRGLTIDRIGAEVTTIGDAGSKLRVGIYKDNGLAYPGDLLLDAGQIAGDSATLQDITISQFIPAGLYWIGGATQSVTTTAPTYRTVSQYTPPIPIIGTTSAPSAGATFVGYSQASVTGALPSTFTTSLTSSAIGIRLHMRVV
jgi:hypothetical protein